MDTPSLPASPRHRGSSESAAFTLIELLAVIVIIGVLVAIVISSVGALRSSSQSSACLTNLRQIALAHQMYAAENNQRLVPVATGSGGSNAVTWRYYLKPYLGQSPDLASLRCPADASTAVYNPGDPQAAKFLIPPSYGINNSSDLHDYLADTTPPKHKKKRVLDIKNPARLLFVADIGNASNPSASPEAWNQTVTASGSYGYATFPDQPLWASGTNWNVFPRHKGRINAAFYDGHATPLRIIDDLINHPKDDPLCLYRNQ